MCQPCCQVGGVIEKKIKQSQMRSSVQKNIKISTTKYMHEHELIYQNKKIQLCKHTHAHACMLTEANCNTYGHTHIHPHTCQMCLQGAG